MKQGLIFICALMLLAVGAQAQVEQLPGKVNYRLGANLTQLMLGQLQLELERQKSGSFHSLVGQVFAGQVYSLNVSSDVGFDRATHWGAGVGGRVYDKAFGSRLFVQMGGYYKETSVWYMQKQWLSQLEEGVPVLRYGDAEVMDRYAGFGGELLAGAQGVAGKVLIEASYGIVYRNMRPVGDFHGRYMRGTDEFFLNLGRLSPIFVGKIGYCF